MSLYLDTAKFYDTKDTELKSLGSQRKLAVDKYGRIIISQYDYCHFEEKLAYNPCMHFWNHFNVVPDKERDIGWDNVEYDTSGRGYATVKPGGYMFTHQPFRYGVYKFILKLPKPSAGVRVYVGLADVHPTEFEPLSFISNIYLKIIDSNIIIGVEGYGGQETYNVTTLVPYGTFTLLTFEVWEELIKIYNKNTLLGSFFADAIIKKHPQRTGAMSLVVKNEGSAGDVVVDLITAEPSFESKAPRTVLRNIELGTSETSVYGWTCVIDKIILNNHGGVDCVVNVKDGEGYTLVCDKSFANQTKVLDLGGLPFKFGVKANSNVGGVVAAHFIGVF